MFLNIFNPFWLHSWSSVGLSRVIALGGTPVFSHANYLVTMYVCVCVCAVAVVDCCICVFASVCVSSCRSFVLFLGLSLSRTLSLSPPLSLSLSLALSLSLSLALCLSRWLFLHPSQSPPHPPSPASSTHTYTQVCIHVLHILASVASKTVLEPCQPEASVLLKLPRLAAMEAAELGRVCVRECVDKTVTIRALLGSLWG